jgi:hypothetical protein
VGRETLRRWLLGEGLWPAVRRGRKHRRRRERRAHFGELVQIDGSPHDWFEGRAAPCCLMVMIDDATGQIQAHFSESESLDAAQHVLARWIRAYGGVPAALYADRLSLYVARREPTAAEKRQGSGALTELGRIRWRLGIDQIVAKSPQAKGRVERVNGTLQDRLVKELRLAGVSSIEAGNAFLDHYLPEHNRRFSISPAQEGSYLRVVDGQRPVEDLVARESPRQVQNDWTLSYGSKTLQIAKQPGVPPAKSQVLVRERLGGEIVVLWQGRTLRIETFERGQCPAPPGGYRRGCEVQPKQSPAPAGAGGVQRPVRPESARAPVPRAPIEPRGADAPRASGPPPNPPQRGHF